MGQTQGKKKVAHRACTLTLRHIHFDTMLLYMSRAIIQIHVEGLLVAIGGTSGILQCWWSASQIIYIKFRECMTAWPKTHCGAPC